MLSLWGRCLQAALSATSITFSPAIAGGQTAITVGFTHNNYLRSGDVITVALPLFTGPQKDDLQLEGNFPTDSGSWTGGTRPVPVLLLLASTGSCGNAYCHMLLAVQ